MNTQTLPKLDESSGSLLLHKRALVFGAAGSVGGAIAREFAAQGAEVFLSGRTESKVADVTQAISATGGRAHLTEVDATNEDAVEAYVDWVVREAGGVDIVFNAIGQRAQDFGSGTRVLDLTLGQFMLPMTTTLRSQFITARAAARHMVRQGSGVIMFVTGSPARPHIEGASAIGAAFAATENFTRHLALELGPHGVRAICLRSSAMPNTTVMRDTMQGAATAMKIDVDQALQVLATHTMLKVSPRTSDTARIAAFLASDQAKPITGTQVMSEIR